MTRRAVVALVTSYIHVKVWVYWSRLKEYVHRKSYTQLRRVDPSTRLLLCVVRLVVYDCKVITVK